MTIRTDTNLLALVVVRQPEAKRALIAEAVLVEVDAVVDSRVDALCRIEWEWNEIRFQSKRNARRA